MAQQTILITGANRGIGLALTQACLAAGHKVIATVRDLEQAEPLHALEAGVALVVHSLHVTRSKSVKAMVAALAGTPIDVLVNNAGVFGGQQQGIDAMDYDAWTEALSVNAMAPFRLTTALLPNLRLSEQARVVTISSQMGALSSDSGGHYAYRSSKAAANKLMHCLAQDLAADGITVCPVHPGWVQTDMGGAEADITPQQSADGLLALIERIGPTESGRFWNYDGTELDW